ncbi:MAG: hypothetical protein WCK39_06470 [Methanomassiliicoccales archaeon]
MSQRKHALQMTAVLVVGILIGVAVWAVVPGLFPPADNRSPDQKYLDAIDEVMVGEKRTYYDHLIPIVENNTYLHWNDGKVLVLAFTRFPGSYPVNQTVNTTWGTTWVTVVPELKDFFGNLSSVSNHTLRVEQLLGLSSHSQNTYLVEFWADPDDLYRPAADNEINDTVAYLNSTITDPTYLTWFNGNIISSYYQQPRINGAPWTRLGYTYDWGSSSSIGLSEFVLNRNATIFVSSVQTVDQYLASAA